MYFSLQQQLFALWQAFLLGVVIGVIYELFRLWRLFCPSRVADFVRDFLFVTGVVLLSGVFYLRVTWGQIRWFYILAQFLGAVLFHKLIGRWIVPPVHRFLLFLFGLARRLLRAVFAPMVSLLGLLFTGCKKLVNIIFKKPFIFIKKYIIILLHPVKRDRKRSKKRNGTDGAKSEKDERNDHRQGSSQFYH